MSTKANTARRSPPAGCAATTRACRTRSNRAEATPQASWRVDAGRGESRNWPCNRRPKPSRERPTEAIPDGPATDRGRARFPPRGAGLRPGQAAGVDPGEERRWPPPRQGRLRPLDAHPCGEGVVGSPLACRVGRDGLGSGQAVDLPRRGSARERARGDRFRRQHGRPGHLHLRLAGAEGAFPAGHRRSERLVVPGIFGAGRRFRSGEPSHIRPSRRRLVGHFRAEDLDDDGPVRGLDLRSRPHQPAGQEAGGHLLLPGRHEEPGRDRPAHPDHRRRTRGQRGVLRRRPRPARRHCRGGEQGLGLRQVPARQRAQRHRPRRHLQGSARSGAANWPPFPPTAPAPRSTIRSSAPGSPRSRSS